MAVNKREFFEWLKTTDPPRRITIGHRWKGWGIWDVSCIWGDVEWGWGQTMCEPRNSDSADKHAERYRRWLREFEKEESRQKSQDATERGLRRTHE